MDAIVKPQVGENVAKLVEHIHDYSGHELSYDDVRETQIAAMNERLQQRIDQIKLVGFRARDAEITEITSLEDVVPLLLPHTAYKSYPEKFLVEKRWDKLTKWLGTVSTEPLGDVDLTGITDIDEWVARMAEAGHYLSCSSGTTGNPAMMMSSRGDAEFTTEDNVKSMLWATDIEAAQDRKMIGLSMITQTPRGKVMGGGLFKAFSHPEKPPFGFPAPPITVGSITEMIALRKKIADGTATPGEISEFDAESARRQQQIDDAISQSADALIEARGDKLMFNGQWAVLHPVAEEVRKRGYSGKDFHPENSIYLAGGLKKAKLPADYREFVLETFNIDHPFIHHIYGMQEIQTVMPRCEKGGRYHIPAWLICLPLDRDGENLMPGVGEGEVEGRAAFFDLSIEGRWGGIISGDRITVDYGPCACGTPSPSIADPIVRYADLEGDDKIACSGTIDAYVRGMD
ncbi:MAG: hypothetical protein P8J20_15990 [Novosphingobium sp.]|nr:hypothetical protein [Novosphingobium sp.]